MGEIYRNIYALVLKDLSFSICRDGHLQCETEDHRKQNVMVYLTEYKQVLFYNLWAISVKTAIYEGFVLI